MNKKLEILLIIVLFSLGAFFTFYKLSESPPTWMDEGLITQTSRNLAMQGRYAIQTAPGEFISPGIISTSYPVTFPIALSYELFGVGILQGRIVMAFYILFFFALAYLLIRKHYGVKVALLSLSLLVTFGPVYGHGKNVLGEVPGLAWLLFGLLLFDRWWAGFLFGLCLVTKPIFILLLPGLLWFRHDKNFLLALVIPVLLWLPIQFPHDSFGNILSIYANPHSIPIVSSVIANFNRFVSETQPLYALVLLLIWSFSLVWRMRKRIPIGKSELVAAGFSVLVYLAYLRTIGYYRYFFLGEVLALVYLPAALRSGLKWLPKPRPLIFVCLVLLVALQFYQTTTNSWVAGTYNSHRTHDLSLALSQLSLDKLVFVYQAPELATFLPHNNYLQYVKVADEIVIGKENLNAKPYTILAHKEDAEMFPGYIKVREFDQYVELEK